ncbi:glycoside hydrolase family 71 protein [Gordonia sp. NPDC003376]
MTATGRKVFAHYMPNFPTSIDNKPSASDYYTTNLMAPFGELGVHAAYGGYLRDRPLPVPPSSAATWKNNNLATEIQQAQAAGIDGFAVDVITPRSASSIVDDMLSVAASERGFSILLTMDMNGAVASQSMAKFVADVKSYAQSPAATRLSDGRLVLSAFRAEGKPVSWWRSVLSSLSSQGVPVAFYPILLDANANLEAFAPISYGLSSWGGRNPGSFPTTDTGVGSPVNLMNRARALGKKWMAPVAFQDNRPSAGIYEEASNGLTMRRGWQLAREQNADWVQLMTWNDYAETSSIAPSVKHGYRLLDMSAYRIAEYKTGTIPIVLRDAVYVTHRTQFAAQSPTFPQIKLMTLSPASIPAVDLVEVTAYATQPSTAAVSIDGVYRSCEVPAGVTTCTFRLQIGTLHAGIARNDKWLTLVESPYTITRSPYVQDLQYVAAGGLR